MDKSEIIAFVAFYCGGIIGSIYAFEYIKVKNSYNRSVNKKLIESSETVYTKRRKLPWLKTLLVQFKMKKEI